MGDRDDGSPTAGSFGAGERLSTDETIAPSPGSPASRPATSGQLSGKILDHFEILERIGAGGFGEVYRARDTRLGRLVAVKVLPDILAGDPEGRERFRREAIAASALNHPSICTVHDLVEADGKYLIVMELVEGTTLHAALKDGPLPLEKLLSIALQVTAALGEAHRAGILHRDVKPGNIALTSRGQVKVLDFGLAKLIDGAAEGNQGPALDRLTEDGSIFGTLSYMSPEQLLSKPLDGRSDLFSLGIVLYEMATGRLPFVGTSKIATADAILHAEPRAIADRPVPEKLRPIIQRLLQKDLEKRYTSADDVHRDLAALQESLGPRSHGGLSRGAWIGVAAAVVVLVALAGLYWRASSRERWALAQVPEITKLIEAEEFQKAAALVTNARAILPKDAALEKLWLRATGEATIETDPPGADVSVRPYKADENAWQSLGTTPLKKVRLPQDWYVWRVTKPGSATISLIDTDTTELSFRLVSEASVPPGMVPVPGDVARLGWPLNEVAPIKLVDYFIDRTEVTNEEYKKFVDAGGYEKREYWKEPFVRNGRTLSWDEAIALFRDSTGRPGPATWEVGTFPKGQENHPVAGLSWYEAAAYAVFVGKSLPTAYHWSLAAENWAVQLIVPGSNFGGKGTQAVGGPGTLSGFGTVDMAGNVKEWCLNESSSGTRLILGGGFRDPSYQFGHVDGQSPLDRGPDYGFRCVKLASPPSEAAAAKLSPPLRDYVNERPVSDEVFGVFKQTFTYDKGPLNAKIDERETAAGWTHEKISLDAAYAGERLPAHLFLPRNAAPPFQVIVFFPGAYAYFFKKFDTSAFFEDFVDFIPLGGRALMIPIYRGQYDRPDGLSPNSGGKPPAKWRDRAAAQSKDLGRSLDYLQTREDIDSTRLAYMGFSAGGAMAPLLLGVEPRFKAAILWSGGFWFRNPLPEVDAINFVTRVKAPVLMLSDRYDSSFPVNTSQLPFYRLLGTPEKDKKRVVFDTGHGNLPHKELIRETFDWLDKYLGPVKR